MKNTILFRGSLFVILTAAILSGVTATFPQTSRSQNGKGIYNVLPERRPFDFSDAFYISNGIDPSVLFGRHDGADGMSVVDFIDDPNFRGVRIIATYPAYNATGGIIFWNHYADVPKYGFVDNNQTGADAVSIAEQYPVYTFPSTTMKNSMRQSALIETDTGYFEKNPLGLGVVIAVEYTDKINTKEAHDLIKILAGENGLSADGTPIIRTSKQIMQLLRNGMVTLKRRGTDDPNESPFVAAKTIRDPRYGAIAPDVELRMLNRGKPLAAEMGFLEQFECLKAAGNYCTK